jgi:hypothetical protein
LPWELLTLKGPGQHLGEIHALHLGHAWAKTETAGQARDVGRVLFAWSAAGGKVQSTRHQRALHEAYGKRFDPRADVLENVGLTGLDQALAAGIEENRPVSVLHLLCHGQAQGEGYGRP